jgi:hypothetical protein
MPVFVLASAVLLPTLLQAAQILPVTAHGWPNERTSSNQPPLAVDGSTATYTWTTEQFTTDKPAHLGLDFGDSTEVNRIRLWKDNDTGGCGEGAYDLVIQYTTDSGPLPLRTWQNVANLTTGYLPLVTGDTQLATGYGFETLQATAVNSDGTVTGEVHDSVNSGHGWASLSFHEVEATGVRISFTSSCVFNHYKVHEFEAYRDPVAVEPNTWTRVKVLYR